MVNRLTAEQYAAVVLQREYGAGWLMSAVYGGDAVIGECMVGGRVYAYEVDLRTATVVSMVESATG